jgi:cyclopropane-fatty-acyl-phospholipid synthase
MMIRQGIRMLLDSRLSSQNRGSDGANRDAKLAFVRTLGEGPIALPAGEACSRHYGLPPGFFGEFLGPRMKYSCCLFPQGVDGIEEAEEAMLAETCRRAGIKDGMEILELGCGWGALAFWIAENYPACRITAVTNSPGERDFIHQACAERGISAIRAVTCSMNDFQTSETFDRIVSVEMFEQMHNLQELLGRIAGWLRPDGKLFVHLFCHREFAYAFESGGENNWMGRYFFAGAMMPSDDLLLHFREGLVLENQWRLTGTDYRKTAEAWLSKLDARKSSILPLFRETFGPDEAPVWLQRWRVFLMVRGEMGGYRNGDEWRVSHYLFRKG